MQDAWNARLPLGSRSRKAEREVFIDSHDQADWQPLARYGVTSGRIGVEVVEAVLGVERFSATADDIALRVDTVEQLTPRGQIAAEAGETLELYLSPRLVAAIARDWSPDGADTRQLIVRFEFWAGARAEREELIVDLHPRLRRLDDIRLGIAPIVSELRLPAPASGSAADRIDMCEILATLPPQARLLKGRIAHSHIAVDIAADVDTVRLLVGDSLILNPDVGDSGAGDVPAVRLSEGGWSFPLRSLIDVAFPSRQRLSLDAAVVNRALPNLADYGLSGRFPIRVTVRHTLAFDGDDSSDVERADSHAFEFDLVYDLSPSFFLELPAPSMAIALFDKRVDDPSRPTPHIPVPLPPPSEPRAPGGAPGTRPEIALAFAIRLIGGTGGQAIQPWYHIEGIHDAYQVLQPLSFPSSNAAPASLRVPIDAVIERYSRTGQRAGRLNLYLQRLPASDDPASQHQITIEVDLERPRAGALLCIDWGASSIAAGITDDRNPQHVLALPLGDVFRNASGLGGRMQAVREGAVLLDEDMPDLIPSRLSLASRRNFRAALNRFSYLDLRAGGDTQAAVDRRIMALDRHYDIALPVPTSMAAQDDTHAELTLPSLKMLLAESRDRVPLSEAVATRGSDGRIIRAAEIVIPHLMLDCLDEIRGFYLTESVKLLAERDRRRGAELERAIAAGDLRLVLTHPCGLGRRLIGRYRDAGRHMLARLDRGLLPRLAVPGDPEASAATVDDGVVLVPESLAAAYFALRAEIGQGRSRLTEAPARLIALDFGAGTFDVSVLDVAFRRGDIESWDIKCHYGVRVGGLDIDRALARLVDALLEHLLATPGPLAYAHVIDETDDGRGSTEIDVDRRLANTRFARALEVGKRQLTDDIYKAAAAGNDWIWGPGRKLRITVGRAGEQGWPVQSINAGAQGIVATMADGAVTLSVLRDATPAGSRDLIVLEIENIFSPSGIDRLAEAPRAGAALHELVRIADIVTRRLPEASLAWLDERGQGTPQGAINCLSVTGRAALWPPIFAGFQELAGRIGAEMIGTGQSGRRPAPMPPDLMKKSVMLGAYYLARFPQFLDKPIPAAPLAIRFIPIFAQTGLNPPASRIAYIEDLVNGGSAGKLTGLDNASLLQVSRVVPGIEKLADLADASGPALWSDLMPSTLNPVGLTVSRTLPPEIGIEVERNDDNDIVAVTFKADWHDRRLIGDDGSTFISERGDESRRSASAVRR